MPQSSTSSSKHSDASSEPTSRTTWIIRGAVALAVIAALVFGGQRIAPVIPRFAKYIDSLGAIGPVVFVAGYAVAAMAFIPAALLTLAAGAIFGLVKGVALVFLAAVIGSTGSFLVARYVARDALQRRLKVNEKFEAVDRAIAREGRRIVLLLRLSPAFPFGLLNYALGLTRISLTDYLIASVGMIPGTLLYVYYGKLAGDVAAIAGGAVAKKDTGYYVVLGLGLLATIIVTTLVTRTARRALREATEGS